MQQNCAADFKPVARFRVEHFWVVFGFRYKILDLVKTSNLKRHQMILKKDVRVAIQQSFLHFKYQEKKHDTHHILNNSL